MGYQRWRGSFAGLQACNPGMFPSLTLHDLPTPFSGNFLEWVSAVADKMGDAEIERMVDELVRLRTRGGRLWIIGLGGSAANASHAANDFAKLTGIEAVCPTDNAAIFTAAGNDLGWREPFVAHMKMFRFGMDDCLFVLSVGGGQDTAPGTSVGIAYAVQHANRIGAPVLGIVGRDGGFTAKHWTAGVIVPTVNEALVTPLTESFQSVILHLLVSHPRLQTTKPRW